MPAPTTSLIGSLLPWCVVGYRHDEIVRQVVCILCHYLPHLNDFLPATISVALIPGISRPSSEPTLAM